MRANSFKQTKLGSDVPLDAKNTWYKQGARSFLLLVFAESHRISFMRAPGGTVSVKQGSLNAVGKIGKRQWTSIRKGEEI